MLRLQTAATDVTDATEEATLARAAVLYAARTEDSPRTPWSPTSARRGHSPVGTGSASGVYPESPRAEAPAPDGPPAMSEAERKKQALKALQNMVLAVRAAQQQSKSFHVHAMDQDGLAPSRGPMADAVARQVRQAKLQELKQDEELMRARRHREKSGKRFLTMMKVMGVASKWKRKAYDHKGHMSADDLRKHTEQLRRHYVDMRTKFTHKHYSKNSSSEDEGWEEEEEEEEEEVDGAASRRTGAKMTASASAHSLKVASRAIVGASAFRRRTTQPASSTPTAQASRSRRRREKQVYTPGSSRSSRLRRRRSAGATAPPSTAPQRGRERRRRGSRLRTSQSASGRGRAGSVTMGVQQRQRKQSQQSQQKRSARHAPLIELWKPPSRQAPAISTQPQHTEAWKSAVDRSSPTRSPSPTPRERRTAARAAQLQQDSPPPMPKEFARQQPGSPTVSVGPGRMLRALRGQSPASLAAAAPPASTLSSPLPVHGRRRSSPSPSPDDNNNHAQQQQQHQEQQQEQSAWSDARRYKRSEFPRRGTRRSVQLLVKNRGLAICFDAVP